MPTMWGTFGWRAISNAESPVPVIFTFAGCSGVRRGMTELAYNGYLYSLLNALPQSYQGVIMGIRCVGIRLRALSST